MENRIEILGNSLREVADNARNDFGMLSEIQLNWKPGPKNWSVAQCFDHLITTHTLYFPLFDKLAIGQPKLKFWEKVSPLSGFFGKFLIKSLHPDNVKKMKTTARGIPSSSEIGGDIVSRFCEHQEQLIERIKKISAEIDPANLIITSPMLGIVTYNLDDCFTILDVHCRRHFNQATRVTETDGFPAA